MCPVPTQRRKCQNIFHQAQALKAGYRPVYVVVRIFFLLQLKRHRNYLSASYAINRQWRAEFGGRLSTCHLDSGISDRYLRTLFDNYIECHQRNIAL
ncbi:hypothetical protein O9993_09645 [Vibrio lentus]|nr:hypothetical protein [Vibrio lentus]